MTSGLFEMNIPGFHKNEVATLAMAIRARMRPSSLEAIEIRGEQLETVQMAFKRPDLIPWSDIKSWYGVRKSIQDPKIKGPFSRDPLYHQVSIL